MINCESCFLIPKREKTMNKTLSKALITKLDQVPVEIIEEYTHRRKVNAAYDSIESMLYSMSGDEVGSVVALLNRAYLDGYYDSGKQPNEGGSDDEEH